MSWLIDSFNNFDNKVAIIHKDTSYSYSQIFVNIERIRKAVIEDKIYPGEVVSILNDYSFNSISLMLALYQNKNIIVPIVTKIENEVDERIKESYTSKSIALNKNKFIVDKHVNKLCFY